MSTEHDSNMTIQNILNTVQKQRPSGQDDSAMQSRLLAAIDTYDGPVGEDTSGKSEFSFRTWLKTVVQPWQLGIAGTTAALVLAVALIVSTSVSTPAFASVVEKLSNIKSMVYAGQMQSNGMNIMELAIYYQSPSKIRVVNTPTPGQVNSPTVVNVMDTELGKGLILFPDRNVAMPVDFTPGMNAKAALENELLDWHSKILSYQGEVEVKANTLVNGVDTTAFIIEPDNMRVTLWVDPATQYPIRIKVETMAAERFVFEADVVFNTVIDPAMFDLSPAGYQIMGADAD